MHKELLPNREYIQRDNRRLQHFSMAPTLLQLLMLTASLCLVAAQSGISNITLGSSLSTIASTSFWPSPSGRFSFGFYPERNGFKVGIWINGIAETTIVWTARRDDLPLPGGATLTLTQNGILLQTQSQNIIISEGFSGSATSASMLDSGDFVLYSSYFGIVWESFDSPTDTILAGQRISAGNQLYSSVNENDHSTGKFRLNMQTDGNLVLYPVQTDDTSEYAYWTSRTDGQDNNVSLNLNVDGHLYMLNSTGFYIRNLTQGSSSVDEAVIYTATLDVDGIFRLYSHSFGRNGSSNTSAIWNSISDKCQVKGFCGSNSYCTTTDIESTCFCPPGFLYVNNERKLEGCERNSIEQDCKSHESVDYSIFTVENTSWVDPPYEVLSVKTVEECTQACMEDCNCTLARYKTGTCMKQRLPLRYGRRYTGNSDTTFVKVGNVSSIPILPLRKAGKSYRLMFILTMILSSCLSVLASFASVQISAHRSQIRRYCDFVGYRVMNDVNLRSFTYRELNEATGGFKEELGRGSFGAVFAGTLFGNAKIAVKKLDKVMMEEGERQFRTEMNVIGKTHHRNLIRLLGYCDEGTHRLLVYQFMCNGSLADLLFRGERRPEWEERLRISMEIAMGLFYLHEECDTQIIHCDIKPQNILIDASWTAKISDFGLAKLLNTDQTRTLTGARGTRGYVAPEWNRHVPINSKVDVYSFGVMLLEIICCRKSLKADVPENEILLSDWVYECFASGKLQKLIAPDELETRTDMRRLERMVMVGLWCIQEAPFLRPSMKRVILMMEGMVDIQVPPHPISPILAGNLTHSHLTYRDYTYLSHS